MTFGLLLIAALALPYLLWRGLRARTQALAVTAAACGIIAVAIGTWTILSSGPILSLQAQGSAHVETYYVLSHGSYLRSTGIAYLVLAAALAVITHFGRGRIRRLTLPAFATFHLGGSVTQALVLAPPLAMPRRYIDYPAYFETHSQIAGVAAIVTALSVAVVAVLLCIVVFQAVFWPIDRSWP